MEFYKTGIESTTGYYIFDLYDDNATRIVGSRGQFQLITLQGFFFYTDISFFICIRTTEKANMNVQCRKKEIFFSIDMGKTDQVRTFVTRPVIGFTAFQPGIDEGMETCFRPDAGLVCCLGTE